MYIITLSKAVPLLLMLLIPVKEELTAQDTNSYLANVYSSVLVQAQTRSISAILPSYAELILAKNAGSKFGKLIAVDSQNQKITFQQRNQELESIPISQIEKVEFREDDGTVMGKPLPPLMGERRTWLAIPLKNLNILSNQGEIKIVLSCTPPISPECKEQDNVYRIDELSFTNDGKVNLIVSVAS